MDSHDGLRATALQRMDMQDHQTYRRNDDRQLQRRPRVQVQLSAVGRLASLCY